MTDTANLGLPCIEGSQAQKHVTHNDALRILDTLVQLAVLDRDLTAPPASPADGQRWIVKAGATGAWAGHDNAVAAWQDGAWQFSPPQLGWLAYVTDESALLAWNGSDWVSAVDALTPTALNNMTLIGVGTTADATNPLSAKLNNVLFTAETVAEGGDGDLRYKLSKEAAANTASFLFQDAYSGRAEIGLTGDDDFHFKVSADGTTWRDAIVIDRTTGSVSFPQGGASGDIELTLAQLTLGVADALNTAQFIGSSGNRFADSFDALTYVDTGAATNLDTGVAGALRPTAAQSAVSQAAGTAIGNLTSGGGLSAAFDGTTDQADSASARLLPSNSGFNNTVGKDWGSGVTKTVTKFVVTGSNNNGINGAGGTDNIKLQGSNDGSSWTDLYTGTAPTGTSSAVMTVDSGIDVSAAYRYHRVNLDGNGTNSINVAELEFFEGAGADNLSVFSTALTAASAPSVARLVARVEEIDAIALNTDLIFSVSRDDGATWTAFTMTKKFAANSIAVYESDSLDISGQPSGTSVKWKAVSANGKMFDIDDIYLYWS